MNMFVSFILRGGIQLLRELLHSNTINHPVSPIEDEILATTGVRITTDPTLVQFSSSSHHSNYTKHKPLQRLGKQSSQITLVYYTQKSCIFQNIPASLYSGP